MNNPLKPDAPQTDEKLPTQAVTIPKAATPSSEVGSEFGGRKDGTDPTRYGDWEKRGKCVDF